VKWRFRRHGELPAQAFACASLARAHTIVISRDSADITGAEARIASCAEGASGRGIDLYAAASKGALSANVPISFI